MEEIKLQLQQLQDSVDEIKRVAALGAKEALSIDEVSQVFDLKKSYLYSLIHRKQIPYYKVGGGKLVFFKKSDVEAFLLSCRVNSIDEAEAAAAIHTARRSQPK